MESGSMGEGRASSIYPWYVILVGTAAYFVSFVDRQIITLLVEHIKADLAISDTQFGMLSGLAFAILYAVAGIPISILADRFSRPAIMSTGVLCWSAATAACGLISSFAAFFSARVFVGLGEAALSPAMSSLARDLFPKERLGTAMAVYSLGALAGAGGAFLVGGAVIAALSGMGNIELLGMTLKPWQATFVIVGLPGVFIAALIFLTVKDPRRLRGPVEGERANLRELVTELRRDPPLYFGIIGGFALSSIAFYAILGWSPAWFIRTFGLDPASAGGVMGIGALFGGGGGVLTSGWLVDRLASRRIADAAFRVAIAGAAGVSCFVLFIPFCPNPGIAAVVFTGAAFFGAFPLPLAASSIQIAAPGAMCARLTALLLATISLVGLTGGSVVVGLLNDRLFGSPLAVGKSIAIVSIGSALSCTAVFLATRGALAAAVRRNTQAPGIGMESPAR